MSSHKHTTTSLSSGFAHRLTGQMEAAEVAYLHSIEHDPTDLRVYGELTVIYSNRHEMHKAIDLLNRGLHILPKSAILHTLIASVFCANGTKREALHHQEIAEQLDPDLDIIHQVREKINRTFKK